VSYDVDTLFTMLSFKRPAGGPTEAEFINRFLRPLGVKDDKFGNLHLTIGENPEILWSCHTDSVHNSEGQQKITLDGNFIKLDPKSKSSCLGADDGAGVFIMANMIKAKMPGRYIFHFGEERGCIGSNAIVKETPEVLKGIKAAIAFDRRNTNEVLTHQHVRTASDAFAKSVAAQLPGYKPSDKGILTDTKVYRKIVPECSNISVGYYNEHSKDERLDVVHLLRLRDAVLKIDPSKFVIARDPQAMQKEAFMGIGNHGHYHDEGIGLDQFRKTSRNYSLADLLWQRPDECASVLRELGITKSDMLEALEHRKQARFDFIKSLDLDPNEIKRVQSQNAA
jgi:hypothetical protein